MYNTLKLSLQNHVKKRNIPDSQEIQILRIPLDRDDAHDNLATLVISRVSRHESTISQLLGWAFFKTFVESHIWLIYIAGGDMRWLPSNVSVDARGSK